jgi:prefoldin subunit 5
MSINANQDYIQFKNDILKDIREFEKNILEQIKAKYSSIDSTLFNYKDQIDKLEKLTKSSSFNIIELKSKLNNLNEYFSFKQKMENLVFNNDIKLKIYIEEIDKIKTKYDKMLDDNLVIPGILGRNCKFKNLKDYIHNNNNEIARLKYAIDEEKKLTSEFKSKFEVLPRSMINMADSAVRRSNEYTELKQKDIEKFINVKFNENNEKIMEIKVSNLESQKSLDEAIKEFKNEINKILNIKNDIEDILNEKINKLKELRKENENKFKEITKEIEEIKNT